MISCNDFKGALLQNHLIAPCHANAIPMSTQDYGTSSKTIFRKCKKFLAHPFALEML
jgi:hypothetical protein